MAVFPTASHADMMDGMPHKTSSKTPWLRGIAVVIVAMIVWAVVASLQQPSTVTCKPPHCAAPPPRVTRLASPHIYTSSKYGFSLEYSTEQIDPSHVTDHSIAWDATLNGGSEVSWSFTGGNANGRDAQQIVEKIQGDNFSDATLAYRIPGADIGYTPGFGNVYDVSVAPGGGSAQHDRLIVMAAVKNGIAVAMIGLGPYQRSTPESDGHPSPAGTSLVHLGDFEETVKSVTWKGDPPL